MRAGLVVAALLAVADSPAAGPPAPASADPDWHIPWDPVAATAPDTRPAVLALDAALARYARLADAGWPAVPDGPELVPGVRDPRVATLRTRLRREGDYSAEMGADPWFFDAALDRAVRHFQSRHGLPEDGRLDARTRAELNVPAAARHARLAAARTRWQWLPRDLGREHLLVNVPAATLTLVRDGTPVLAMRTVVGHPERPTPSFTGPATAVTFHPAWSVPTRLAVEDLLPRQQADADFFARLGIAVLDGRGRRVDPARVDWAALGPGRFPYRLVQAPGPANSLGRVKIAVRNPYDIYLHDSPSRPLFTLTYRTLGAGCIRLEEPAALVTALLAADRPWTTADTDARFASGTTLTLALRQGPPVWVVYLAAWADADGTAHFRPDVYGRDARLAAALGLGADGGAIRESRGPAPPAAGPTDGGDSL